MPAMGPPPPRLGGRGFVLFIITLFLVTPFLIAAAAIWFVFVYLGVTMVQFLAVTGLLVLLSLVYGLFKRTKE